MIYMHIHNKQLLQAIAGNCFKIQTKESKRMNKLTFKGASKIAIKSISEYLNLQITKLIFTDNHFKLNLFQSLTIVQI